MVEEPIQSEKPEVRADGLDQPVSESATNAGAVIAAVRQLVEAEKLAYGADSIMGTQLLVLPKGKSLFDLEPILARYRHQPRRRNGTAKLTTLGAFIEHANRFKDDDSVIFLDDTDPKRPELVSVLNYHRAGGEDDGDARYGDHRGEYAFPLSEEWRKWTSMDGRELSQADFATFLEDRIPDVLAPSGVSQKTQDFASKAGITFAASARLLELSRGLAIKVDTQVANHVNLSTGEAQIVFKEEHTAAEGGNAVKVPNGFCILIPVVRSGPVYPIPVRLRYRISQGRTLWKFSLYRTDVVFEDMLNEAATRVNKETGLPVYYGQPERPD